jgi:hypothetical protein
MVPLASINIPIVGLEKLEIERIERSVHRLFKVEDDH